MAAKQTRWRSAVTCGILGWVLDAYDFFVLVFLLDVLAKHFAVGKPAIIATITATLFMRPVGALLIGLLSDRWGRKYPLLLCVLYFSLVTALTPFAPNYTAFLILRLLYGIGMGGYWGVGAAVVMESSPTRWRGLFSGLLQSGYSIGYLLAALAARRIEPRFGWQWMFLGGLAVALVIVVLSVWSSEPETTKAGSLPVAQVLRSLRTYWPAFLALTLLMTVITCLSHGTQDLYPDFLKATHGFTPGRVADTAMIYNVGAILGALVIGRLSDRIGRRNAIYLALGICILAVPAWAFGTSILVLTIGAFVMQFGVQGAFGVIPAHLNELSPASARSLFPGLAYQLGVLIGAPCVLVEYALHDHFGYQWALALFEGAVFLLLFAILALGRERHGRDLAEE